MLLWARKFTMAKTECRFEKDKYTPLGVPFIWLVMVHTDRNKYVHGIWIYISIYIYIQ